MGTQIMGKPKRGQCSKPKDNCLRTGCCATVGYTCFQTKADMGKCLKNCTPSATQMCTQPQFVMDPILQDAVPESTSLYCFSVYTQDTGSTKPSYELDIIKEQYARKISVFQCEQSDVFADVDVEVGPGLRTIQVDDVGGDFHLAKRKTSGTWVNTGMFTQIWKKITKHVYTDWVAKVDADAVFIPDRLRSWLGGQLVPSNGIYLENCKYVDYGYFGNLEVFSKAAFTTLVANIDRCKASSEINWKVGVKNGKYGPMGEDLFAQTCLDMKGVRRIEAFDITTDGACPADRPQDEQKNKMEAQLRVDIHSSHASIQEKGRVVPVLGCHSGCLRAVSFACCQSQQIAILPAQVPFLDYHLTTPLKGSRCIHLSLMGIPGQRQGYTGVHAWQGQK